MKGVFKVNLFQNQMLKPRKKYLNIFVKLSNVLIIFVKNVLVDNQLKALVTLVYYGPNYLVSSHSKSHICHENKILASAGRKERSFASHSFFNLIPSSTLVKFGHV